LRTFARRLDWRSDRLLWLDRRLRHGVAGHGRRDRRSGCDTGRTPIRRLAEEILAGHAEGIEWTCVSLSVRSIAADGLKLHVAGRCRLTALG